MNKVIVIIALLFLCSCSPKVHSIATEKKKQIAKTEDREKIKIIVVFIGFSILMMHFLDDPVRR